MNSLKVNILCNHHPPQGTEHAPSLRPLLDTPSSPKGNAGSTL